MSRALALVAVLASVACAPPDDEDDGDENTALALPELPWCDDVRDWPDDSRTRELELAAAIDEARTSGGRCGTLGVFAPAAPVVLDGALACAARKHAADMDAREFFAHADPEGDNAVARMRDAGYVAALSTELIGAGDLDAQTVLDVLWLASDPHCAALLAPEWRRVGIAHRPDTPGGENADGDRGAFWVVVLASAPR